MSSVHVEEGYDVKKRREWGKETPSDSDKRKIEECFDFAILY